jgi:hypothetical protein
MFNKLPEELVRLILSYDERFKYRNGIWMNQIPKNDKRFSLLGKINRNIAITHKITSVSLGRKCVLMIFPEYRMYNAITYYYIFNGVENITYTLQ